MKYYQREVSSRSKEVAAKISARIQSGELPVGAKLPIEPELSREYEVSRSTIREAMKYLAADGFVSIQQGRGTFVTSSTCVRDDFFDFDMEDKGELLRQLLETRLLLEPQIALAAVQKATEQDIERLERIVKDFQSRTVNDQEALQLDIQFHRAVAECTHNQVLTRLAPLFCEAVAKTSQLLTNQSQGLQQAQEIHVKIFEAIKTHDAIGARYAMEKHIQETIQLTRRA